MAGEDDDRGDQDTVGVSASIFVVMGGDAASLLEPVEATSLAAGLYVQDLIVGRRCRRAPGKNMIMSNACPDGC
jgi:hypothetical protein